MTILDRLAVTAALLLRVHSHRRETVVQNDAVENRIVSFLKLYLFDIQKIHSLIFILLQGIFTDNRQQ